MSDSPDDQDDDGQGEAPEEDVSDQEDEGQTQESEPQHGQPREGQPQPGQPSGDQTRGGQPQARQTQGGQPQAGQTGYQPPQGQPPQQGYQTGPTVGEIFERRETMSEIKLGLVIFAAVTLGLGISGFGLSLAAGSAGTGFFGGAGGFIIIGALVLSPLIAAVLGIRFAGELVDQPDNLILASAAVVGSVGTLVAWFVGIIFFLLSSSAGGGGGFVGELFLPVIVEAIGVGITGALAAWAVLKFTAAPRR